MSNPYETAADRVSILGPTLQFKGELSADDDLIIRGRVEGTIKHKQRLTIGPEGRIAANISAQTVIVEGVVEGDVSATKSVLVKGNANVRGNLSAPSVSILEGATFNGGVDMSAAPASSRSSS
jgi:cytoskeletal protein CcmA (bactofilin family)